MLLFNDLPFWDQTQFLAMLLYIVLFCLISLSLFDKYNQLNLMGILQNGNSYLM